MAQIAGIGKRVMYHFRADINVTELKDVVELIDESDGQGVKFIWKDTVTNPPTKAELLAYDDATVEAWYNNKADEEIANYDNWADREKIMIKLLAKENNSARAWFNSFKVAVSESVSLVDLQVKVASLPDMPERTLEQIKAALKAEKEIL